jgi:hypothetical protein
MPAAPVAIRLSSQSRVSRAAWKWGEVRPESHDLADDEDRVGAEQVDGAGERAAEQRHQRELRTLP